MLTQPTQSQSQGPGQGQSQNFAKRFRTYDIIIKYRLRPHNQIANYYVNAIL